MFSYNLSKILNHKPIYNILKTRPLTDETLLCLGIISLSSYIGLSSLKNYMKNTLYKVHILNKLFYALKNQTHNNIKSKLDISPEYLLKLKNNTNTAIDAEFYDKFKHISNNDLNDILKHVSIKEYNNKIQPN